MATPAEDALEADIEGRDDEKKLAALEKLVGLSAPSSVPLQYVAFQSLRQKYPEHKSVRRAIEAFNEQHIKSVISQPPPQDEYSDDDTEYY